MSPVTLVLSDFHFRRLVFQKNSFFSSVQLSRFAGAFQRLRETLKTIQRVREAVSSFTTVRALRTFLYRFEVPLSSDRP